MNAIKKDNDIIDKQQKAKKKKYKNKKKIKKNLPKPIKYNKTN